MADRSEWDLCSNDGLGRAPVFRGHAYPAVSAFLPVDAYRLENEPIGANLLAGYDGSFRTLLDAEPAFETNLGNLVHHVTLPP